MEGNDRGFHLVVYQDWERGGYEIVASQGGQLQGTEFVPWMYEPRWGVDAADHMAIDLATDKLLDRLGGPDKK